MVEKVDLVLACDLAVWALLLDTIDWTRICCKHVAFESTMESACTHRRCISMTARLTFSCSCACAIVGAKIAILTSPISLHKSTSRCERQSCSRAHTVEIARFKLTTDSLLLESLAKHQNIQRCRSVGRLDEVQTFV